MITFNGMKDLFEYQLKLNSEISSITNEMNKLPEMPDDMEAWIDCLSDIDNENNFKLSDFNKIFKFNKQYNDLLDRRADNSQKIKVLVIDNLIERIKVILEQ